MSDAELTIWNDTTDHSVQFTTKAQNTVLYSKGTHTVLADTPSPVGIRTYLYITAPQNALIALCPVIPSATTTSGNASIVARSYNATTGVWTLFIMTTQAVGDQLDWWAFAPGVVASPGGGEVVFEIYEDAAGSPLLWSLASTKLLKVVDVIYDDTDLGQFGTFYSLTIPDGRRYAIIQGAVSGYQYEFVVSRDRDGAQQYFSRHTWDGVTLSNSTTKSIRYGRVLKDTETAVTHTPARPPISYQPRNALVVDVTGL